MAWTLFWDMHSGGDTKLEWDKIYIESPEDIAVRVFAAKFDRQADNVTCPCCGDDYSVQESSSLEEATAYHRGHNGYSKTVISVEDYISQPNVKVIYKEEILPEEEVTPLYRQVYYEEYY